MTDLEMTKLCAEAMELEYVLVDKNKPRHTLRVRGMDYWPLENDAQAMALVKMFPMTIEHPAIHDGYWQVESIEIFKGGFCPCVYDKDLNRAIVECVANMKSAK